MPDKFYWAFFCKQTGKIMGYETKYDLQVDNGELVAIVEELRSNDDSASYALDSNGDCDQKCKWYKHEQSLIDLSKKYPQAAITLFGNGEDAPYFWKKVFKDGVITKYVGVIEYKLDA